ncbi:MAG TPA: right-handed parallel beta-helix repeat-containing protein [Candidatus Binatia bacterium]|jgi:hypothetical protein|nr:right-handed parallel beta-helix repeat-containing protein [Candidatus Binatia bacterium]
MLTRALAGLVFLTVATAHATDIVVPDDYPTIQAAVDAAASAGDRVLVRQGEYPESVKVEAKTLTIEGLDGTPTLLPGPKRPGVFQRKRGTPSRLTLQGVAITGGSTAIDCDNCSVYLSAITDSRDGIRIRGAGYGGNTVLVGNALTNIATGYGIHLRRHPLGQSVDIEENVIVGCGKDGIHASGKSVRNVEFNNVTNCRRNGIVLKTAAYTVTDNRATTNGAAGIVTKQETDPAYFLYNWATDNGTYGLDLKSTYDPSAFDFLNPAMGNGVANIRTSVGVL